MLLRKNSTFFAGRLAHETYRYNDIERIEEEIQV